MHISALLDFIESHCEQACTTLDLTASVGRNSCKGSRLRIVIDAEPCLGFLYGGLSSDWVSGGEWGQTEHFLHNFIQNCALNNIEIAVFFNGVSERGRLSQWYERQSSLCRRIQDIIRIIKAKAYHPPKAMWVAPVGLTSILRFYLHRLGVATASSYKDHHLEIISYIRENNFDGVISWDADLMMINPPRYFSAKTLAMTRNGSLFTTEISMDDFARQIDLNPNRFCLLATLLGTHLLPAEELQEFYSRICGVSTSFFIAQYPAVEKIHAVIDFVRRLENIDDLDAVAATVFGHGTSMAQKAEHLKRSVNYYVQGAEAGLSSSRPLVSSHEMPGSYSLSMSKVPSPLKTPHCSAHFPFLGGEMEKNVKSGSAVADSFTTIGLPVEEGVLPDTEIHNDVFHKVESTSQLQSTEVSALSSQGLSNCAEYSVFDAGGYSSTSFFHGVTSIGSSVSSAFELNFLSSPVVKWWKVAPEILDIALERHKKALMIPWIYQVLVHGEIFLSPLLEDEAEVYLIRAVDLFCPVRQKVYSVLLERNPGKLSDDSGVAIVKEWSFLSQSAPVLTFNDVEVPPPPSSDAGSSVVQRMWLGLDQQDIVLRTHKFLDCFDCLPIKKILFDQSHIRAQYLVLCCVLRYMLIQKIVDEDAVKGFLATAVSQLLHNQKAIRELRIPVLSVHSIQLATVFMHGFENAVFANDAFGSPLPAEYFCPSQFFDGKLFQYKMVKISQKAAVTELCENSLEQQMYFERMHHMIFSLLPKDYGYACPHLQTGTRRQDAKAVPVEAYWRPSGLQTEVQSRKCTKAYGKKWKADHNISFEGRVVIPCPDKNICVAAIDAPPRRKLRGDSRTKFSGNRFMNDGTQQSFSEENHAKPGHGQGRLCERSLFFHSGEKQPGDAAVAMRPISGRGRACTVDIESLSLSDNYFRTSDSDKQLTMYFPGSKTIGRGQSLMFEASGLHHQHQKCRSSESNLSKIETDRSSLLAVLDEDLEMVNSIRYSDTLCRKVDLTEVCDTVVDATSSYLDHYSSNSSDKANDKCSSGFTNSQMNSNIGGYTPCSIAKQSDYDNGMSLNWNKLVEAQEKVFAKLSLQTASAVSLNPLPIETRSAQVVEICDHESSTASTNNMTSELFSVDGGDIDKSSEQLTLIM